MYREEDQDPEECGETFIGKYALQDSTGRRGYFGKLGSTAENSHRMKTEPRSDSTRRAWRQREHKPASVFSRALDMISG
jgi:hypothetical protein